MNVKVGSFADPPEWFGLAHFLEHMLFLGTKKYPQENAYKDFLSKHGGRSNASTSSEETNYHFEVSKSELKAALDIFAQFFIDPLFTVSGTTREMNAVNSEHDKNKQNDVNRFYQLLKTVSNPKSCFHRFSTGNLETLNKEGIREALLDFYDKHYSANIMKLCIYGAEPLDVLEEWTKELFSGIQNKNKSSHPSEVPPFELQQLGTIVSSIPVKEKRKVALYWPVFPSFKKHYLSKPSEYFSHLLGHESEGSIYALLKEKGWATSLSAGCTAKNDHFELFKIDIELTEEGFKQREEVISIVYEYVHLLRESEPEEWIFEETKKLNEIKFRFLSKQSPYSYCETLSSNMQDYPPEHYLMGRYVSNTFDPALLNKYKSYFSVDNFLILEVAPELASQCDLSEKWYGTKYSKRPIPEDLKKKWGNPKIKNYSELHLPHPNPFIPSVFDLKSGHKKTEEEKKIDAPEIPTLIHSNEVINVWHLQDKTFLLPKAHISLQFVNPLVYHSPLNFLRTQLITLLIDDELNEYTYSAYLAGLGFSISHNFEGIEFQVSGYDEKLPILLHKILQKFFTLEIREDRLEIQKKLLTQRIKNISKEAPHFHASYALIEATTLPFWSFSERLQICESGKGLEKADLQSFLHEITREGFYHLFCFGNVVEEDTMRMRDIIMELSPLQKIFDTQYPLQRLVDLPKGVTHVYSKEGPNPEDENSCIYVWYPIGSTEDYPLYAKLYLVCDILKEKCFSQLRTQEQLGYIVWSGIRTSSGYCGFRITIQSSVKDPVYLDERIEAFIESSKERLTELTSENYQKYVQARILSYLEKDHSLRERHDLLWSKISDRKTNFTKNAELAKLTQTIQLEEIRHFFDTHIYNNETRKKLSGRVFGKKHPKNEPHDLNTVHILNPTSFKNSLPLHPRN
eukprot:TRINITY_DN21730_c0_g1_i1.p1 TRINITY_DN21730_c0_g1~~TRINITY_DN21730_c0_g1_i1.p1  ORF type:complete len:1006 (+),score=214.72 TRINITY_DN21730_c0_g1_i1:287-3019(+)